VASLQLLVHNHYGLSIFLYIVVYIVSVAFSLPGAAMLTIAGGFLFGVLPTALFANVGATGGSTLAFLGSRYLFGAFVQDRYKNGLRRLNDELQMHGHNYLLVLRLIPIFPFFFINVCAGLTKISLKTFVWTTSLGIIPGSLVYAFAGKQLVDIKSPGDIISYKILLAFGLLAVLALVPVIIQKWMKRNQGQK